VIRPREIGFVATIAGGSLLVVSLAWLYWPNVHRSGPADRSLKASLAAVVASVSGLLPALAMVCGGAVVAAVHAAGWAGGAWNAGDAVALFGFVAVPLVVAALLRRAARTCAALARNEPEPNLPPRCEGCGYSLTHRPADERCPECGLSVVASLGPHPQRCGTHLQRRACSARLEDWLAEAVRVLRAPREHYALLRLRSAADPSKRLQAANYALIGTAAGLWLLIVPTLDRDQPGVIAIAAVVFPGWVTLGCWVVHRTIAAVAFSYWIGRRTIPDGRWALRVIRYESCFLWVFCTFWGVLVTSYITYGQWISGLVEPPRSGPAFVATAPVYVLGIELKLFVVLAGTVALAVVWLWRYHRIGQAIRWSNF